MKKELATTPLKTEEDRSPSSTPRYRRFPTQEDLLLSELKVDRETRLRRISGERDIRSRHLNAMADRRLLLETRNLEQVSSAGSRVLLKQRQHLQAELLALRREKSLTIEEHLSNVRERTANKRKQREQQKQSPWKQREQRHKRLVNTHVGDVHVSTPTSSDEEEEEGEVNGRGWEPDMYRSKSLPATPCGGQRGQHQITRITNTTDENISITQKTARSFGLKAKLRPRTQEKEI